MAIQYQDESGAFVNDTAGGLEYQMESAGFLNEQAAAAASALAPPLVGDGRLLIGLADGRLVR